MILANKLNGFPDPKSHFMIQNFCKFVSVLTYNTFACEEQVPIDVNSKKLSYFASSFQYEKQNCKLKLQ